MMNPNPVKTSQKKQGWLESKQPNGHLKTHKELAKQADGCVRSLRCATGAFLYSRDWRSCKGCRLLNRDESLKGFGS